MFLSLSVEVLFSLAYFLLLSSVSSPTAAFNNIHFLAAFTGSSVVRALCLFFFPYFKLLPLTTLLFTPPTTKNPFWNSPASWSYNNIKFNLNLLCFLLFSQKSSVVAQLLFPLFSTQYNWFYSDVPTDPYVLFSAGGPHTHSVWPGVTRVWCSSSLWSLLKEVIHADTC